MTPSPDSPLRLGTRRSPLALAQAEETRARLCAAHGWPHSAIELVTVVASGDRVQDRPLSEIGGKALWTKELDAWLDEGLIDAAVHSMKDVETIRPAFLTIAAILPREDVRDVLVGAASIASIPPGARVGTSAPRRAAQMLHARPDLTVLTFRGNVATRIAKLAAGEADVTLLAAAGLARLGETGVGTPLECDDWMPAPAQGAIGIECRVDDAGTIALLGAIDHAPSRVEVMSERALLAALGGTCHSPIAVLCTHGENGISMRAALYSEDGAARIERSASFALDDSDGPARLARELLADADPEIVRLFDGPAGVRPASLLVVRPEPGNAATLAAARALGLDVHGEPLFEIMPVAWLPPPSANFDAVLIGSANVLRHGGEALVRYKELPAYVVGQTTAEAARQAGFAVAAVGSGGLQALAGRLAEDGRRRVLRLAGTEHVPLTVPPETAIAIVVIYEARPLPLNPASAALLGDDAVVMLHSAAAAHHFARECDRIDVSRASVALACLGPRIAAAAGEGWASVFSAERPDDTALLALAARMCQSARFEDTDNNS